MKNITKLPVFGLYEDTSHLFFDFNRIIPMPEDLQIEAGSLEHIAVEMAIRFYEKNGDGYKEYHQYSDEDFTNRRKNYEQTDLELADIGLKYLSNAVKYQASNWYIWAKRNWGTKWNSYELNIINKDCIQFQTAWNPPIPVLLELSRMNPKTLITNYWCDEFIENGSGYLVFCKGEVVKNEITRGEDENRPSEYAKIVCNISGDSFTYDEKKDLNILIKPDSNVNAA